MVRLIGFMKRLLGFDSPHSWMKYLRIPLAIVALFIALSFWANFGSLVMDEGLLGLILSLVIFLALFTPLLLIMVGVSAFVGVLVGGSKSGIKQRKSYKETLASGSQELISLEKLRLKSLVLNILFALTILALIVLGFLLVEVLYDNFGDAGIYGYFIVAALIVLGFLIGMAPVKARYKQLFKEQIVFKGLEAVLDKMDFRPEECLKEDVAKGSGLFSSFDVFSGNDYLQAEYQGRTFVQSDIHLQKSRQETYRDKNGNIRTKTVYDPIFRGRLVVFDFDALSNEPVAVYDRLIRKAKGKETIQTELEVFNQRFYVTAENPVAALRILTPQVLEGIVLAADKLGFPLSLSFREDKLYVALANGDTMEASIGDATLEEQRQRVTWEIQTILDLAQTLYLKK